MTCTFSTMLSITMAAMTVKKSFLLFSLLQLSFQDVCSVPLLDGAFSTTDDVDGFLRFGLDISSIQQEIIDIEQRKDIYTNGFYAYKPINGPAETGQTISLASLSLDSAVTMSQDHFYNLYRYYFQSKGMANGEADDLFYGNPSGEFANTIVMTLLDQNLSAESAEAILVLNVWLTIVHELHKVIRTCTSGANANASLRALDKVAALWIGPGQLSGNNEVGYMLYRLAEIAGNRFGQDVDETLVNTRLLELLNSIQSDLSIGVDCSGGNQRKALRNNVYDVMNLITVPLIQNFIHHVMSATDEEDAEFVKLYQSAVMPQLSACDPNIVNQMQIDDVLSMSMDEKAAWIEMLQSQYSCFRLSCDDIGTYVEATLPDCVDGDRNSITLANYSATSAHIRPTSYLDRDISHIDILMRLEAYEGVKELYRYGYNSAHTLRRLTRHNVVRYSNESYFHLFADYYGSPTFLDDEILNALDSHGEYDGASPNQLTEIVVGMLKYNLMFLSAEASLQIALEDCWQEEYESALLHWDTAAVLFIGSIEGEDVGGDMFGQSLYASNKKLCQEFEACTDVDGRTDALTNQALIQALSVGRQSLENMSCQDGQNIMTDIIKPELLVPLFQGVLSFGRSVARGRRQDWMLGIVHALSGSVLPIMNLVNEESAAVVDRNLRYQFNGENPMPDGFAAVLAALDGSLPLINISCQSIGHFSTVNFDLQSVCSDRSNPSEEVEGGPGNSTEEVAISEPPSTAPTFDSDSTFDGSIAFGRYNFTSIATALQFASLAIDVRGISEAATGNEGRAIYEAGSVLSAERRANQTADEEGMTLSSISTVSTQFMVSDPMFNLFKRALYDDGHLQSGLDDSFTYSNDYVQELFRSVHDNELVAEATVVLNVWMLLAHELYNAVGACKIHANATLHVDAAVALWIGFGQEEGVYDSGWMMYAIAQRAAQYFGFEESEAAVNMKLMQRFVELQTLVESCSPSDDATFRQVRIHVSEILRLLSIPLLQHLFVSISQENSSVVELYSNAVIPQCVGCGDSAFTALQGALFADFALQNVNDDVIQAFVAFLRCLRISCEDLKYDTSAPTGLKDIISDICLELEPSTVDATVLGYHLSSIDDEASRIDLDVLQISIFMQTRAYDTALEYYQYGQNSYVGNEMTGTESPAELMSLQNLARNQLDDSGSPADEVTAYASTFDYYNSTSYVDDIVLECIERQGRFEGVFRHQLGPAMLRIFQVVLSFRAVLQHLQSSVNTCSQDDSADVSNSVAYWDVAVAYLIGSIGLENATSLTDSQGVLMYSVIAEECVKFGTCDDSTHPPTTSDLFSHLRSGRDLLQERKCAEAQQLLDSDIHPLMQIPLLQGTLSSSVSERNSEQADQFVEAFIFAFATLPIIHSVNKVGSDVVAEIYSTPERFSIEAEETADVFEAVRLSLPDLQINCEDIGILDALPDESLCIQLAVVEHPVGYLRVGIEVAEMAQALLEGQNTIAKEIYTEGLNIHEGVALKTLQSLSTEATARMLDGRIFNLYLYSFSDGDKGHPDFHMSRAFADRFILEELENPSNMMARTLAAEATVVLNIWIYIVHTLEEIVVLCEEYQLQDITSLIDEVIGYWVGDARFTPQHDPGHLMYGLTERNEKYFDFNEEERPTTNEFVLDKLSEIKTFLLESADDVCTEESERSSRELYDHVNSAIALMTIPMFHGLVHHLSINDRDYVRLFSYHLVPLMVPCNPLDFDYFNLKLLKGTYEVDDIDELVTRLYQSLPCLKLRCDQVGMPFVETVSGEPRPSCESTSVVNTTAVGYENFGSVFEVSRVDMDLREMDILMRMTAYDATEKIYLYGLHSEGSLSDLAINPGRSVVPFFETYATYFGSDTPAHDLIERALTNGIGSPLSDIQRRTFVLRFGQVLILQKAALQLIFESAEACQEMDVNDDINEHFLIQRWDVAAGMLLGSLTRTRNNWDSTRWYAPFDLAEEYCQEFGTCETSSPNKLAHVNERTIELLYAGRGAILSGNNCGAIRGIGEDLQSILWVPIIQATLSASLRLSHSHHTQQDVVEAYVFSRALLPVIGEFDSATATSIAATLSLEGDSKRFDTSTGPSIFIFYSRIYDKIGVDCELIGETEEFNACYISRNPAKVEDESNLTRMQYAIIGLAIAIFFLLIMVCLLRKKRDKIVFKDRTFLSGSLLGHPREEKIRKSFKKSKNLPMSQKATKVLTRIKNYGDDDQVAVDLKLTLVEGADDSTVVANNIEKKKKQKKKKKTATKQRKEEEQPRSSKTKTKKVFDKPDP